MPHADGVQQPQIADLEVDVLERGALLPRRFGKQLAVGEVQLDLVAVDVEHLPFGVQSGRAEVDRVLQIRRTVSSRSGRCGRRVVVEPDAVEEDPPADGHRRLGGGLSFVFGLLIGGLLEGLFQRRDAHGQVRCGLLAADRLGVEPAIGLGEPRDWRLRGKLPTSPGRLDKLSVRAG